MATKLTKPVVRETELKDINNVTGPVIVTMDDRGITFRSKGRKRSFFRSWADIAKGAVVPSTAPARFISNPLGWLVE